MKKKYSFSELLSPVGNLKMCEAAIHNGADAIYVGFPGFNARGRTIDLSWDELAEMIALCHKNEVKVFLALNVLIFEKELRELVVELCRALALNPDAFIVQDIGLVRLIHFMAPQQVVHASTQMTVTNHEHIAFTEDLNLKRYVLSREVSLLEMESIRASTSKELEVFVHGALCVSYSGQCLTSEGFGGRSANRGQCAQSCRLEYELIVDGEKRELGSLKYLVSPKDLCGLEDIPKLISMGINSFKIEGRLKTPEYVAATSSAYKSAINNFEQDYFRESRLATVGANLQGVTDPLRNLEVTYSRGFFNGWMDGVNHQKLVDGRYGSHRGAEVGLLTGIHENGVMVTSRYPLNPGDGILFVDYSNHAKSLGVPAPSWGGRVFASQMRPNSSHYSLQFSNEFLFQQIPIGATLYLNDSPATERELARSYTDKTKWKTLPLEFHLHGQAGTALRITISDGEHQAHAESALLLQLARNPSTALNFESATDELSALSGTGFRLAALDYQIPAGLYIAQKELRQTRQRAIQKLQALRNPKLEINISSLEATTAWLESINESSVQVSESITSSNILELKAPLSPIPALNILVREFSSLENLNDLPLATVYLDFEHGKDYKVAVEKVRSFGYKAGIATTRILKPNEYHNLKVIESIRPDVVLVRNLGSWKYLQGKGFLLAGDFSLNASNSLTAEYLLNKGLSTLCPAYDLNQWQLFDLIDRLGGKPFEITVHQYLPSFHMEHCVFAAFLSKGTSFRDCGKPCETHRVELRDHTGALHPLKADQECRNTMFNGKPQSAARLVPELISRGVKQFRIEALYENGVLLRSKVLAYAKLLRGESSPEEVYSQMGIAEKYGVMEGQLRNQTIYKDRKKT